MHLVLNAICLIVVGRWVERILGWQWVAIGFLATGFMGSVLSLAMMPDYVVSVGASGAIMGLAPVCLFALNKLRDTNFKFNQVLWVSAVLGYALFDALAGKEEIDHAAHIGGAISGGFLALMLWGLSWIRPQPLVTLALHLLSALGLGLFAIITLVNLLF